MAYSKDEQEFFDFGGKVVNVAEREMKVSVFDDRDNTFLKRLLSEWISDGRPKGVKKWIRDRLSHYFRCVDKRPIWVQEEASWPFLNGEPMTFVTQYEMPDNEVTRTSAATDETLYVFVARTGTPDSWELQYRVVSQCKGLRGLRLAVRPEDVDVVVDRLNEIAEEKPE